MDMITRIVYESKVAYEIEDIGRMTVIKEADEKVAEYRYNDSEGIVIYKRDSKVVIELKNPIRDFAFEMYRNEVWTSPVKIDEEYIALEIVSGRIVRGSNELEVYERRAQKSVSPKPKLPKPKRKPAVKQEEDKKEEKEMAKTILSNDILNTIISDAKEWKDARDKERGLLTTDETVAIKKRIISGEFNKCEEVVDEAEAEIRKALAEAEARKVECITRVDVLLDNKIAKVTKKPVGAEIGKIAKRLPQYKRTISLRMLSTKVGKQGCSWKASVMSDTSNTSYVSSSLVALDIDNKESYTSVEEFMALEHKYQPCFIYETFSSVSERERFRVVYAFDSAVCDYNDMCLLYKEVQAQYPEVEFDLSVDPGKILFGGKKLRYFNNVVNKTPEFDALNVVCEAVESEVGEYTPSHSISENDPIKDVIRGNLRNMVSEYGNRIVKTSYDINDIIYKLPLGMVLGLNVGVGKMFNCVLEGHSDNNASANIYQTKKKGYYMYKCFGCDSSLYITDFIDREEICEILNIRTMWYERNRDIINYNRRLIGAPEVLVEKHKNVYKKVTAYYKLCSVLLDLAEEQLERLGRTFTTDKVENIIISERYVEIARRIAEKFNAAVKADRKNVQNQLDILMLMRFVVKLTDDELAQLNPKMLMRNKSNVKSIDPKYNTQYGIMINKWDMIVLTDAEDMLVYYKEIGATTLGASQRQSIELGCDTRSKNTKSNDTPVLLDIKQCLIDYYDECVNTRGYVLKDEFIAYAKAHNTGKRLASTFITMLNRHYGLTSAIVNKDIISKHEDLSAADSKKRIFIAAA